MKVMLTILCNRMVHPTQKSETVNKLFCRFTQFPYDMISFDKYNLQLFARSCPTDTENV